ncbi:hypothetical protein E8E13_006071 [Curvularia kusanoi]|uniref:Enoyl reductase (ER) domain-containing protein n=1 Tax=Curvularia kusanoi TaxID=90978 RepID=A0A9P4W558_CURKU|nr:hypothetical protein E8E13_006071 [Curvularia kusanoi]
MSLPRTMSGELLTGHGGPDRLQYRSDLPLPVVTPTEVLIRVAAAGLNNTDINTRIGWYSKSVTTSTSQLSTTPESHSTADAVDPDASWTGAPLSFPRIQGADCAGYIAAVGSSVSSALRIGQRVIVRPLQKPHNGATATAFDAWTFGSECDGAFAQYTKAPASEVYAINAPHWTDVELGSVPCKMSVDVVLDVVAGPQFGELLEALKRGGRYAVAGAIADPMVELDVRTLYLKDLSFFGCTHQDEEVFANLVGYMERGEIKPHVGQVFKLQDIRTAQEVFQSKAVAGKLVLEIN